MFFRNFGVIMQKSIRRRVIINSKNACIKKQMRLSNLQYKLKEPTRFTYRIEYIGEETPTGRNFIPHLTFQG